MDAFASAQLPDAIEQRLACVIEQTPVQKLVGALAVDSRRPAGEHGELLDLGGEHDRRRVGEEIERLDAEWSRASSNRRRGSSHRAKANMPLKRRRSLRPMLVGVDDHLVVAAVRKRWPCASSSRRSSEVVDLAVADQPAPFALVAHRLMTAGRIDDLRRRCDRAAIEGNGSRELRRGE